MILLIDNFDSFTYNIAQMIQGVGVDVEVYRNNALDINAIRKMDPDGIIVSPGPGRPKDAGISRQVISTFHDRPLLGICLGYQCIAEVFGGRIVQAKKIMHGKRSVITHDNKGLFDGIPQGFSAVRYHSLVVDRQSLPDVLVADAFSDDGEIMGVRHERLPAYGVQFHPESIASEYGAEIMDRFIQYTREET
ncbi:MAG: aminodeoxychorismate/anthranilate synthase component II [Thermodesulfobacteriota bacterium]|nr:aminodeoxychorismate/anthranilate synthase component II [Thermodesulfobacteriota bacterium]